MDCQAKSHRFDAQRWKEGSPSSIVVRMYITTGFIRVNCKLTAGYRRLFFCESIDGLGKVYSSHGKDLPKNLHTIVLSKTPKWSTRITYLSSYHVSSLAWLQHWTKHLIIEV